MHILLFQQKVVCQIFYNLLLKNKLKYLEGKKGCYWKLDKAPSIYWSNSVKDIKADIKFKDPGDYFQHRYDNGYPQNWSNINIFY